MILPAMGMMQSMRGSRTSQGKRFIVRPYRRVATWFTCDYMTTAVIGKGWVTNLSCTGMRLAGEHVLISGTSLTLRIILDDRARPLEIPRATVCWVNRYDVGVRFDGLDGTAARRIVSLLNAPLPAGVLRSPSPANSDSLSADPFA